MEQELSEWIGEQVLIWGGLAGALSAVIALVTKQCKPIYDRRKKEKVELAAYRKSVKEALDTFSTQVAELSEKMDNYEKDIIYQQRYNLKMAHARFMRQGWCTEEEKAAYLDMYDYYKIDRNRNSLADSYKSDVMNLPSHAIEEE